jgi:hypothetical protein
MQEEANFAYQNFKPIGIRQFEMSSQAGETKGEQAANFVGVTRAPAWVGETDAEQLAGQLAGDAFKSAKSPDTAEVAKKQKIEMALRSGNAEQKQAARNELGNMEESGEITRTQRRNIERGTTHTYLENAVKHLSAQDAMKVFEAAEPAERDSIVEEVRVKILRAHLPPEDKRALLDQFDKLTKTGRKIKDYVPPQ